MKILKRITGILKKGVDIVKDVFKNFSNIELQNATQCRILIGIGVACVIVGSGKLKYFREIDDLNHAIEVGKLRGILNMEVV